MSLNLALPAVEDCPVPTPAEEPSDPFDEHGRSHRPEPPGSTSAPVAAGAAVGHAHSGRRHAAAMIRQLSGRTGAALRRELDRFFASRPDLSRADRAEIARAMARFRNQLLHGPRRTLREAAAAPDPAGSHPWLDAAGRLFGLIGGPQTDRA